LPTGPAAWLVTNAYAMRHWIHTDFLEKYEAATGKGMPTTTDEYFDYMIWCRDNDPNGNGQKDEIGWSGSEKRTVWYARPTDFLMHAFTWNTRDGYYLRDDKIHANFVEDDYREGLKFLNKMMEEGLMDENYPDNDENGLKTLVALNDGYTVASGSWGGMHNAATDHHIRNMYQIVAPLKGPKGFQNAFYNYNVYIAKPGPVVIPSNSAKPELAMAWFDSCYDVEVSFRQRYGEKGVDWDVPGPTEKAVDGGPGIYKDITNQWNVPTYSHWFTSGPSLARPYFMAVPQPEKDANGNEIHDLEKSLYDATALYEKYVTPCAIPDFYYDEATSVKANEWMQLIEEKSRSAITEFIFGSRDIDSDADWDAYKAELEASNLEDYLNLMQTEYERSWVGTMPQTYTPFPPRT
jgi:putative aldouronate transport system substrate-binding protein